jgi:hypothetical protein
VEKCPVLNPANPVFTSSADNQQRDANLGLSLGHETRIMPLIGGNYVEKIMDYNIAPDLLGLRAELPTRRTIHPGLQFVDSTASWNGIRRSNSHGVELDRLSF